MMSGAIRQPRAHKAADLALCTHRAENMSVGADGQRTIMIASIRYLSEFIKHDGQWLFAERRLMIDWTRDAADCGLTARFRRIPLSEPWRATVDKEPNWTRPAGPSGSAGASCVGIRSGDDD